MLNFRSIARSLVAAGLCALSAGAQPTGTYRVHQQNQNGCVYQGTLYLDSALRGQMVWDNHLQAIPFQAESSGQGVHFTLIYPNGLRGDYGAAVTGDGSQLFHGGCRSNTGETGNWSAQRIR